MHLASLYFTMRTKKKMNRLHNREWERRPIFYRESEFVPFKLIWGEEGVRKAKGLEIRFQREAPVCLVCPTGLWVLQGSGPGPLLATHWDRMRT